MKIVSTETTLRNVCFEILKLYNCECLTDHVTQFDGAEVYNFVSSFLHISNPKLKLFSLSIKCLTIL